MKTLCACSTELEKIEHNGLVSTQMIVCQRWRNCYWWALTVRGPSCMVSALAAAVVTVLNSVNQAHYKADEQCH